MYNAENNIIGCVMNCNCQKSYLPQISEQFIKDFVKAYGKITECEIECDMIKAPFEDEDNPADMTYKKQVINPTTQEVQGWGRIKSHPRGTRGSDTQTGQG